MIIPISDDWRIRSDRHQWILEQRQISDGAKHKGREYWTQEAFYSTIESAAYGCFELRLRLSKADGLYEAVKTAKSLCQELQTALEPSLRLSRRVG